MAKETLKLCICNPETCFIFIALVSCLQEEQQLGKAVDIGGAVNTMLMHLARANLAGAVKQIAVTAIRMQQKPEIDVAPRAHEQNRV